MTDNISLRGLAARLQVSPYLSLSQTQKDLIAGSVAGLTIVLTGHPLDTIKIRMQVLQTGFRKTTKNLLKKEGFLALYKGVRSPMYSTPFTASITFASYESANRVLGTKPGDSKTLSATLLSGLWAGFVFANIITPIDLIKTKLQMEGVGDTVKSTKVSKMVKRTVRNEGVKGLYRGLGITFFRDIPYFTAQFAMFEAAKQALEPVFGSSPITSFGAGALAVLSSWVISYPQDVIKTRIQCSRKKTKIKEAMREIYSIRGLKGFWKGLSPCIMRAVITGAVRFVSYEKCQEFLSGSEKY
jgi:solute carrier family 25 carnitine/acylcarnitine transporter 20/29